MPPHHLDIISKPEKIFSYLKSIGLRHLVKFIHKIAKANPYSDAYNSTMWQEQSFINFPLLYLASLFLYQYGQERGCTTFIFATRDCCHWYKIFSRMYPHVDVVYFNCSRNMLSNGIGNNSYKKYVTSVVDDIDRTVFIDVHGTGRRMFHYFWTCWTCWSC